MIQNRELGLDDYLAMSRRHWKLIVIPMLAVAVLGFGLSFFFPSKYTSQSLILVEEQKVPEGYVKPVITEDLTQRIATMQQQVLSLTRLQPLVERLGLTRGGKSVDEAADEIRQNVSVEPVVADISKVAPGSRRKPGQGGEVPGFYLNFTASNAREAQQVCNELTSMLLEENLKSREQAAQSTTDFLSKQLEDAKRTLDDQDAKMAVFKRQYMGQLPGDEDNNLKLLMALNSQLDANTQALNRAQQDKSYTESLLAQGISAWKSGQSTTNPQSLQQQLSVLQSQLLQLQSKYTDDHPDVIKAKTDVREAKKKLEEANAPITASDSEDKGKQSEPPEIRQLRLQVHQYENVIVQAGRDQKKLQQEIAVYQGRMALSPGVEEQYKQLTRDYDSALKFYQDLLGKKSESEMATDMERRQQGEQMRLLNPANLPASPSFPNRWLFAGGGLGVGLGLGLGLAFWFELRDTSIRNEQDVTAALELPVLISLPWLGESPESPSAPAEGPPLEEKVETEAVGSQG